MQLDDLLDAFGLITDWEERYRLLIDLGRKLPGVAENEKIDANRVEGCTSQVWLIPEVKAGDPPLIEFRADSDSFIVKGLLAIILLTYSGKTPEQIVATDIRGIFERLGLEQNLTPNRRSGFYATVERIKDHARTHAH
jgi:cysteine desulfuration protein SufE